MKDFALGALAAALVQLATSTSSRAADYTVGLTATLSGDFASYGQSLREGADLALKARPPGAVKVTFDTVDDHGSAGDGVLVAQRFCSDDRVVGVLGYTFSSVALAAVPIYDGCKLPVLASAVTSPDLSSASPFFRRDVMTDAAEGRAMGRYAAEGLGLKKVYVLNQQDDYGIGVAAAFGAAFKEAGGAVVGAQAYNLGTADFRTVLAQVKAAAPDAVFIGGFYTEASKIMLQARQLGLDARFLGTDGALNAQLLGLAKGSAEGLVVYGMFDSSVADPAATRFIADYRGAYGRDPDVWAALGYDAAGVMLGEIDRLGRAGPVGREALNAALSKVSAYPGVTGPLGFTPSGDREGRLYFFRVENGRFVLLPSAK